MRLSSIASAAVLLVGLSAGVTHAQSTIPLTINSVDLVNPQLVDGVLTATGTVQGTLAGLPFTTDIENFTLDLFPDQALDCPILHLELAPINLQLLGLHVDTSAICLEITAIPGGGLLGDLLCGLAGLDLGGILDGLLGNLPILGGGSLLGSILELALGDALDNSQRMSHGPGNGGSDDSVCTGECEILELVLGPVDLTLLGLNVLLDDCEGGPVMVCVSATRSEGILGALLCALAGPQLLGLDLADITQLVNFAEQLLADGVLSGTDRQRLIRFLQLLLRT